MATATEKTLLQEFKTLIKKGNLYTTETVTGNIIDNYGFHETVDGKYNITDLDSGLLILSCDGMLEEAEKELEKNKDKIEKLKKKDTFLCAAIRYAQLTGNKMML